jgi:ATP-dependent RNA helicase DHX37/DHR1
LRSLRTSPWHSQLFSLTFFSQTQAELPSSLPLQSSSSLGTGKVSTHQELLDKLEDKETRRAMEGRAGKRRRHGNAYEVMVPDDDDSSDVDLAGNGILGAAFVTAEDYPDVPKETVPSESAAATAIESSLAVAEVGSALQRNPDGTVVAPRIRQKTKATKVRHLSLVREQTSIYKPQVKVLWLATQGKETRRFRRAGYIL